VRQPHSNKFFYAIDEDRRPFGAKTDDPVRVRLWLKGGAKEVALLYEASKAWKMTTAVSVTQDDAPDADSVSSPPPPSFDAPRATAWQPRSASPPLRSLVAPDASQTR
jgi:hypothetical protein